MNGAPAHTSPLSPPPCTTWCTAHGPRDDWDYVGPAATTKTCAADIASCVAVIRLERFAAVERGQLIVNEPVVRLSVDDAVSLPDAQAIADAILGAVDSMRLAVAG